MLPFTTWYEALASRPPSDGPVRRTGRPRGRSLRRRLGRTLIAVGHALADDRRRVAVPHAR